MSGESLSRTELLQWVNATCALQISRLEELGNGVAFCVLLDSITEDLPLKKLKWNANQEVDFLANFKILSSAFVRHSISKPIPVEKLVKRSLAPNLEFLQFMRSYWISRYPEGKVYDAAGRRAGQGVEAPSSFARTASVSSVHTVVAHEEAPRHVPPVAKRPVKSTVVPGSASKMAPAARNAGQILELQNEVANLRSMTDAAIGERDFYFGKLRDVEILMQTKNLVLEKGETLSDDLKDMLASLEKILYATAEGFEVPAEDEQTAVAEGTTA